LTVWSPNRQVSAPNRQLSALNPRAYLPIERGCHAQGSGWRVHGWFREGAWRVWCLYSEGCGVGRPRISQRGRVEGLGTYHGSRRCSRHTFQGSNITKYTGMHIFMRRFCSKGCGVRRARIIPIFGIVIALEGLHLTRKYRNKSMQHTRFRHAAWDPHKQDQSI